MNWLILTLAAMFLMALVNIIDKIIVSKNKDPRLATIVSGSAMFVVFGSFALYYKELTLSLIPALIGMLAGIVTVTATYYYYQAFRLEEVSKLVPLLALSPVYVIIISWLLFDEKFTTFTYLGIILVLFGSFLITHRKIRPKKSIGIFSILLAGFLYALSAVLLKMSSISSSPHSVSFWIGIGSLLVSLVLIIGYHKKIDLESAKKYFMNDVLSGISIFMIFLAIASGPVSLVSTFMQAKPLFVFILALALSRYRPNLLSEELRLNVLMKKGIAIALIIAGAIMII